MYLIHLTLGCGENAAAVDQITETAAVFLKTKGAADRKDIGCFRRDGRGGKPGEVLHLICMSIDDGPNHAADPMCAQALEGVLRTTLKAIRLEKAEVRVYDGLS